MRNRMIMALLSAAGILLAPAMASAVESCPFGQVLKCARPYWHQPPRCRCVGPGFAPGGKAEIHKRNVPTVQLNKAPGGYN